MNKWKTKFSYWKFDKKILLLVTVSILIVTLTVAGVSLTFSIASMKEQSVELLQMQNNTVAESFKGSMDSYKEIVLGTIMDDSVQNYCRQVQKNELKTADIDAVYSKLENLNNMYESLNFAAIVSSDYKSYYYRGKGSLSVTQFEEVYPQAYERCKYAQKGTLKVSYNNDYYNDYYKGNRYTLSLYYPLYDTRKVSDARGLLCMNFDDPAVQRMLAVGDSSAETRVVDTGGMILLSNDKEETGRYVFSQCSRIRIKSFLDIKPCGTRRYFISHTDNTFYSPAVYQLRHLPVKSRRILSRLQYIRKNQCPFQALAL